MNSSTKKHKRGVENQAFMTTIERDEQNLKKDKRLQDLDSLLQDLDNKNKDLSTP